MHKYFAKPLFLGKKVQFLPECHSTNEELNKSLQKGDKTEGLVIYTDHQIAGRGQRGNVWLSERGKNVLFSFFLKPGYLLAKQSYLLNIICGLSLINVLRRYTGVNSLSLKWPNDVYLKDRKLAGILVETSIEKSMISEAVIGIGLNVNQTFFHLSSATSLKMETGITYEREDLIEELLVAFEQLLLKLKSGKKDQILQEYYACMRWRGERHSFRANGASLQGEIVGIDETGKLLINANNMVRSFDIKEIEFLY